MLYTVPTKIMTKVIDVGSNSVRLMSIVDGVKSKILKTTQLGRGLHESGRLGEDEMQATIQAIGEFLDGGKGYIFATEAVRASQNGKEFCKKIEELYQIKVDLLSKDEEARAGFLGATGGTVSSVIDIGGASTEFATQSEDGFRSISLPLGAVRLTDMKALGVDTTNYSQGLLQDFSFDKKVYAIGGTATSIALMVQNLTTYEIDKVHGYILRPNEVKRLLESLDGLDGEKIYKRYPVIGKKRASVIYEGIKLLDIIITRYSIKELIVSDSDNTEGYLLLRNL